MTKPSSICLVALVALAGCGGSGGSSTSSKSPKNVKPTVSTTASGASFSAPGMALHFDYPTSFRVIPLAASKRTSGNTALSTHAAVGVGQYDLLVVTRFPKRPIPVTSANIARLKPIFDAALVQTFGRAMSGRISTAGGQPALLYDEVPTAGLPVTATTRAALVFYADDEYELQCQATPARHAVIARACDQMLATLSVG